MILWLTAKSGIPPTTKALLLAALRAVGVNSTDIIFSSLHTKVPELAAYAKKKTQASYILRNAEQSLRNDCQVLRPNLIVINDEATLRAIVKQAYSLSQVRGSRYEFEGIPVLVLEDPKKMWGYGGAKYEKFIYGFDMQKLARFARGKTKQEPAFNFTVCKTVLDVRVHCAQAKQSTLIAEDIETRNGRITCIAFTYDFDGRLNTFCVPFFDPLSDYNGNYWATELDEIAVRRELRDLQACPVPKLFQNGTYDCAYLIEEGMPPVNYLYDTANMMHAVWCEAPKKLHILASLFVDFYQYWKDENKGFKEDGYGKTRDALFRYWRYNGLDTYYCWLVCNDLIGRLVKLPWAVQNYNSTIALGIGPCLASSLRGLKCDEKRHTQVMVETAHEAEEGLADIRRLVGEEGFNPRSTAQVAWFLYDVLGAQKTRLQKRKNSKYGPRSTDEKVLKLIKEQRSVVINNFIDRLLASKQPAAVISKYGTYSKLCRNGRFLSWLSSTATVTSRFNSGGSQFWTGTNAQNIPQELREYYVADSNYVYVEYDYSASDDRFIAYEAEDPAKIETVEDKTKDIHCKHCSIFFSTPYEKIYEGYKKKERWIVHSTEGLRQNTKRVTHGRNYDEEAETMYNVMGRDAVVATAVALGHVKAMKYSDQQLIQICGLLIDKYDHPIKGMYKRLRPWKQEIAERARKNDNLATAGGFTRKFFGSMDDPKTRRDLASLYGQGGTAGNINRALRKIFYSGLDDGRTCLFLLQVHDSLLFAVHRDHLDRVVPAIRNIMEEQVTIHGRSFSVPASPKIGLTWSERMMDWKPGLTYAEIQKFENDTFGKKFKSEVQIPNSLKEMLAEIEGLEPSDEEEDTPGSGQEDDETMVDEAG